MSMIPFLAFLFSPAFAPEPKPAETKPEPDEIGRVLLRAADILRQYGWHTGGCFGPDGSVCAGMALSLAENHSDFMHATYSYAAESRMGRVLKDQYLCVSMWNDHTAKNVGEVISVMEKAAYIK